MKKKTRKSKYSIVILFLLTGCTISTSTASQPTVVERKPTQIPSSTRITTIPSTAEATYTIIPSMTPIPISDFQSYLPAGTNGSIEVMELITDTGNTIYYEITYWSDGLRVKGLFGYPKGEGLYPAVIFNRGGNRDYGALSGWELIPFVESGYVAIGSQYRGNVGGEGIEEFGGADINDVLNLIVFLKSLPMVDPERIAMVGMSRGGMETYIALKLDPLDGVQDIQVAAVVSGAADLFMWSEELDGMLEDVMIPLIGASPDERPDLYEARSGTYWPEMINAPLLIQHGEDDDRISVEEARKMAEALQQAGKTVKLIIYPDEDHALSHHNKGFPEIMAWFQEYLELPGEDLSLASHREAIAAVASWFLENHPSP